MVSLILAFLVSFLCYYCFRWFRVFLPLILLCSLFFILLFVFPAFTLCVTKTRSNHRKPQNLKFCFWCFASVCGFQCWCEITTWWCLHPDIFTWPREEPLKMVFVCLCFALNNVLKYLFLQCFLKINQCLPKIAPPPPKKKITLHSLQPTGY